MYLSTTTSSPINSSSFGNITILRIGIEKKKTSFRSQLNYEQDSITVQTITLDKTEFNSIKGYRSNMHEFEDHNELTKPLIFFWSYYNIENSYRKVRRLDLG